MTSLNISSTLYRKSSYLLVSVAVKTVIGRNNSLLQRCGYRKNFRRRTRLKGIADAEISPLLIPGHLKTQGADFLLRIVSWNLILCNRCLIGISVFSLVIANCLFHTQLTDFCIRIPTGYFSGIVQIKGTFSCHGENLPIIGIHNYNPHMIGARFCHPLLDPLFHSILYIHIQRRHYRIPVDSRLNHPLQIGVII